MVVTSMATSAAYSFALAASTEYTFCVAFAIAALYTSNCAASTFVAISASWNWVFWNCAMDLPNCFLSFTYATVVSSAPSAIPSACAAIPIRPPSSVCIAIAKPLPFWPSRFSLGILQSVKISSYVEEPRIPILFSFVPKENPGVPFSTINAEISFCILPRFSILPVTAITMYTSASLPFVIKHLLPFSTHSSPSRTAFVCCPCASVPAPGSVRPKAPSFSPFARGTTYFCFCSSVP